MRKILSQWRECRDFWQKRYEVSIRDKQFIQSKQWESKTMEARVKAGVATVTWPLIRNYYNHQIGKALPGSVDFHAVDVSPRPNNHNDSEKDAAVNVLNGVIRFIDRQSKAHAHRQKARKDQFSGGIGWLGVDYVYSDGATDGDIQIKSPKYFQKIYIDPHYNDPTASDATYSFELVSMNWETAKGKYGNRISRIKDKRGDFYTFDGLVDCNEKISTIDHYKAKEWIDIETKEVTIAVHHWRRKVRTTYYIFNDQEYIASEWKEQTALWDEAGIDYSKAEKVIEDGWMVEERTICGWSVLEEREFFINRIPWTPVFGYTMEDGSDYTYHGVVHDGVNLQEHANWLASQHATKTSNAKTIALINNGVLSDGMKSLGSKGGIEFYGVDFAADGTAAQPAQILATPDDGTKELEYLRFTIELLRQIMSTDNESSNNQMINSAQQLALHISDRDSVREEMDLNWRAALECHYSKVVEGIQNIYTSNEMVRVVDLSDEDERIGTDKLHRDIGFSKYEVVIKMAPSGTVQRQQAQQLANAMISSGDPVRVSMGLLMSVDNSEMTNKRQILKKLYKQQVAQGNFMDVPQDMLKEILKELEQSGQMKQALQQAAEPMAQQRLQELLQDKAIQAQLAGFDAVIQKSSLDVQKSGLGVEKAAIDSDKAVKQDIFQAEQQQQQTLQDQYRTIRQYYDLQQEIASVHREGVQISAELINRLVNLPNPLNNLSVPL